MLDLATDELNPIAHLTKQTLGFYRDTGGLTNFQVAQQIENLLSLYECKFKSHGIEIVSDMEADTEIFGNVGEFRQVVSNLVVNAADAMQLGAQSRYGRARVAPT